MDDQEARSEVLRLLPTVERAPDQPFPGGADDREIADLQRRLGMPLPAVVNNWLRVCKGETICAGGVYGLVNITATLALHPQWREFGWLPVAGDGCGNEYVLIERGDLTGFVGFVETAADEDRLDYLVASGLWHFLRFLLASDLGERGWPFNPAVVLAIDPRLAAAPANLLPWHT